MAAGSATAAAAATADQSDGGSKSADHGTECFSRSRCGFRGSGWCGAAAGAASGHGHSSASGDVGGDAEPCRRGGATAAGLVHQLSGTPASAHRSHGTGEFLGFCRDNYIHLMAFFQDNLGNPVSRAQVSGRAEFST